MAGTPAGSITGTGGERVRLRCDLPWLEPALAGVLPGGAASDARDSDARDSDARDSDATLSLHVQSSGAPFEIGARQVVTRGAWSDGDSVLLTDACGSGFDLLVYVSGSGAGAEVGVTARYRPESRTRAANSVLRSRFWLLARQVLVHYPVLWRAGLRGGVPLHVSAFVPAGQDGGVLLIGPGGIGKSTLLQAEAAAGALVSSDNLCVWSSGLAHGLVEPLRVEGGSGRRSTHGRREQQLAGRVDSVRPDRLVLLRRDRPAGARPLPAAQAASALVAGTYAAGELRRYWAFAAVLALGTGRGPAHPPIEAMAGELARDLPCLAVSAGRGRLLTEVLDSVEGAA